MKLLFTAALLAVGPATISPCANATAAAPGAYACCKTCSKGKACGDSCIARNKQCHQPRGCACDG